MFYRLCILLLVLCATKPGLSVESLGDGYYTKHQIEGLVREDNGMAFLVLGDWGRNGHFYQRDVAKWMDVASRQLDAAFIATTGDNFYDNGVASVDDPYWKSSFEAVYHQPHLFVDWYPVLGNHDYRGNWQAQIDYSQRSRRWQMPSPYYAKTYSLDSTADVLLVFIDTSPLNPDYQQQPKYASAMTQDASAQLQWLTATLAQSRAKWKVVIGHHPLYSSGKRYGKTDAIRQVLEPVLESHKVDAYFAGHEHDLQHNQLATSQVAHFVSGGGSEIRPVGHYAFTRFAKSAAGFAAVSLQSTSMTVHFIDHNGEVVYRHTIHKES